MPTCAIKWCGKRSSTCNFNKDGITFHRFPKCPERKSKWINATFRGDSWFPTNNSVICSRHFTSDNFYMMKLRRRLMDTAVPTLFLPILGPQKAVGSPKSDKVPSSSSSGWFQPSTSKVQAEGLSTPTSKIKILALPDSPPDYNNSTKKRLCRRIIELKNTVERKNKDLKKVRDCNRRLKRKITSLKSLLEELEKKEFDNCGK